MRGLRTDPGETVFEHGCRRPRNRWQSGPVTAVTIADGDVVVEATTPWPVAVALVAGLGLSLIPAFYVAAELVDGRLRAVLGDHAARPVYVSAVCQRSRHLSARVRAFIELLREHYDAAAWAHPPRQRRHSKRWSTT